MNRILLISILSSFTFVGTLQAQIFGGWFRGYNNNYYNNGYYRNYQQPQQQSTQPQYKENTWYKWKDGSYKYYKDGKWNEEGPNKPGQFTQQSTQQQQTTEEESIDYPNVYNPSGYKLTNAEKYIISRVNGLRSQYRLPPLVVSPGLMNSARSQTNMMRSYGMQHGLVSRPFGSSENIAPTSSPSYAVDMWIKSSPHFSNMLGGSHRFIGVGCLGGYATQQFSGYSDVKYSLVNPEDKKEEVKEESKTSNDITDTKEEVKDQDQSQDQETKVETSSDEVSVQETNAIKEDSSKITEEVKEEISKKNSSENENKNTDTDSDVNSDDQKKNKKLGFFEPKPLPEGAYIEKVPVKGGVPGEYLPVLRYR